MKITNKMFTDEEIQDVLDVYNMEDELVLNDNCKIMFFAGNAGWDVQLWVWKDEQWITHEQTTVIGTGDAEDDKRYGIQCVMERAEKLKGMKGYLKTYYSNAVLTVIDEDDKSGLGLNDHCYDIDFDFEELFNSVEEVFDEAEAIVDYQLNGIEIKNHEEIVEDLAAEMMRFLKPTENNNNQLIRLIVYGK